MQQTVRLRDGGRTIEASLPSDAQSLPAFGVVSKAVLETTGVVTVGTAVTCFSLNGPAFFGTLRQRHGHSIAQATAIDFLLGGCGGRSQPLPVTFIPAADSVAFKPRRATISLTVCAGRAGDDECGTLDSRIELVKAK